MAPDEMGGWLLPSVRHFTFDGGAIPCLSFCARMDIHKLPVSNPCDVGATLSKAHRVALVC